MLVAINTRLMPEEIGYILEHSGARLLVVDPIARAPRPDGAAIEILRCGGSYEQFLAGAPDGEPEPRLETEDDTISVNYTSGTTGRPKGVMYTHRGAYLNALAEIHHARHRLALGLPLDAADVPLQRLVLHLGRHRGGRARTSASASFDPGEVWRLLDDEGVTHFCGAPTVLVMLGADGAAHPARPAGARDDRRRTSAAGGDRPHRGARLLRSTTSTG